MSKTISGTVDDGEDIISDAIIKIVNQDTNEVIQTEADENGEYSVEVSSGEYHVIGYKVEDSDVLLGNTLPYINVE